MFRCALTPAKVGFSICVCSAYNNGAGGACNCLLSHFEIEDALN